MGGDSGANPLMATGVVKWFDLTKGWGFVTEDSGEDCFCHKNDLLSPAYLPQKDDRVEFRTEATSRGLNAREVRKV